MVMLTWDHFLVTPVMKIIAIGDISCPYSGLITIWSHCVIFLYFSIIHVLSETDQMSGFRPQLEACEEKMTSYWAFGNAEDGEWTSYQICKVAGCACTGNTGNVFPPPRVSDPGMHRGTCVKHVPWCMPWSVAICYFWSRLREKRSRHSRRMRLPQFFVSGKRSMHVVIYHHNF